MATRLIERLRPYFKTRPRADANGARPPAADTRAAVAPARASGNEELVRRRDQLAREFAELQWDLGGLTYEMAIRDHIRLDLLVRRAAKLQAVDAELAAAERMLHMDEAAAAGDCDACGALYARGAVFCWQCGKDLMPRTKADQLTAAPLPAEHPAVPG